MTLEKYEDVFFYLDLTKDYIKKKTLINLIEEYIEKKKKFNIKGQFGLLFFRNDDFPIFSNEQSDSVKFAGTLDGNWKNRSMFKSNFEKGLFYILSYIADSIRKKSKSNRIIIITDTPSDLSEAYQEALFNIVSRVKYFPTFIDIIRVVGEGNRFFKDDVKLNILVSDTRGGIFYIHDKKELSLVFNQLVKVKELVNLYEDKLEHIEITEDDLMFYRKLSKKLIDPESKEDLVCVLCNKEICPVCLDVYDIPNICEECGAPFHNCCVLDYTVENNIGIPFIFRCPKCNILLQLQKEKLDKNKEIKEDDVSPDLDKLKSMIQNNIKVKDTQRSISMHSENSTLHQNVSKIKEDIPAKISTSEPQVLDIQDQDVKVIRVGGYFGKKFKVHKKDGKVTYEKLGPSRDKT